MDVNADASIRHTTITDDPPALSQGPHATAMLPAGHPDLRRREMLFLPLVKPSAP
jgi:hypothetical protein